MREDRQHYVGCFDWGNRSPIAVLAIATSRAREGAGPLRDVVLARQWLAGGYPAIAEAATLCASYDVAPVVSNEEVPRAIRDAALSFGMTLSHRETKEEDYRSMFESLRLMTEMGGVRLPKDPFVMQDLLSLYRHLSSQGKPSIYVPTAKTGRHAEFAPVIARVATMPCAVPAPPKRRRTMQERFEENERKHLDAAERKLEAKFTSRAQSRVGDWSLSAFRSRVQR